MVHTKFMIKRCYKDEKPPAIRDQDEHMDKSVAECALCGASRTGKKKEKLV